ncbi:hypothetical protein BJ170DRAFT_641963 [Xylariales sp. AK1849]|nr:hypothetical protein BJ170DRAFT_641963 [Xylariales sp. AK1849]
MVNPTKDSEFTEQAAYEKGKAELKELRQSWSSAKDTLIETFVNAVHIYKTHCDDLGSQRDQRIQQILSKSPLAGDALAQSYKIPQSDNGLFVTQDILYSYQPKFKASTGASTTFLQSNEPLGIESNDHDITTMVESIELVKHNQSPTPISKPQSVGPNRPSDVSVGRGLRARPAKLCPLKTSLPPIRISEVSKGNYWVFEYRTLDTYGYYVMRCPSNDCSYPVFSKNPLCNNRAEQHFKQCGYPFKGVSDMVLRYARPVISGRRNREVTKSWARKHNRKLLASDEAHFERENFDED